MEKKGTATIGTQVWKYNMVDMFDDFPAADYEHGNTPDMERRFNEIREHYIHAGYKVTEGKKSLHWVSDENGNRFRQLTKSIFVADVPLKCLNGRKAKTLVVNLWINL